MSERYINNLTGDFIICFSEHLTEHPKKLFLKKQEEMALASYCSPTVRGGVLISLSISLPSIRGGVSRDSGEEVGLYFSL